MTTLKEFLGQIPAHWFLVRLTDHRKPIRYAGDLHEYQETWVVELQHLGGGWLVVGVGKSPKQAMRVACEKANAAHDRAEACMKERLAAAAAGKAWPVKKQKEIRA
jgi:hypothetical protein